MCTTTGTAASTKDLELVIYGEPMEQFNSMLNRIRATTRERGSRASRSNSVESVQFTNQGGIYITSATPPAEDEAGSASLLGLEIPSGQVVGLTFSDIQMDTRGSSRYAGEQHLSLRVELSSPAQGAVEFGFAVNGNSAVVEHVRLVPDGDVATASFSAGTLLCIAKNGGSSILPVLVKALPALIRGPQAYIAAVVPQLPGVGIEIIKKIVDQCL